MKSKLTHIHKLLLAFSVLAFSILGASGQITVQCKAPKNEYLAYEKVDLQVTITNRAGQPIRFKNTVDRRWIQFVIEKRGDSSLNSSRDISYKPPVVATGKSMTSSFAINQVYDLSQPGNYTAYAIVRLPGQSITEGFRSNKVFFNIVKGFVSWKQKAGVPGTSGDTREYRIINVSGNERSDLYVQVEDIKRGRVLATYSMGRNLSFRKFNATLDNKNNLHVLFLTTPTLHCHTIVDPSGKTTYREYHQKTASGQTPKLITTNTGLVGVVDSIAYNPKVQQEKRNQIHNLSEIPAGL